MDKKIQPKLPSRNKLKYLMPILFGLCLLSVSFHSSHQSPSYRNTSTKKTNSAKNTPTLARPVPLVAKLTDPPNFTPLPTKSSLATSPKVSSGVTKSTNPRPVVVPAPGSSVSSLTPTSTSSSSGSGSSSGSSTPPTTTGYTSTNWSGYLSTGASFSSVSASWTATQPTGNGTSTSADATWIGIGGVTSSDLIQVGTDNVVSAGGQVYASAFYEMLPAASQTVPGIFVSPGDAMTASVTEVATNQWNITITDTTNNETYSTRVSYSSSLSSAEWIEEDPSHASGNLIPFDNFGTAVFSGGSTISNGSSASIAGSNAQPITMVNSSNQDEAIPSAINSYGTGFSVNRVSSN